MKDEELQIIKISAAECLADSKTPFERDMFRTQLTLVAEIERLKANDAHSMKINEKLQTEITRLGTEVEDLMKVDYWQDRHNIMKAELEKLREAMREFDNDDNWLIESEYADRHVRTGRCDMVYVGKYDPRVFATLAIRGEPLENTKSNERRDLSPFYTPDEKLTKICRERDEARNSITHLRVQVESLRKYFNEPGEGNRYRMMLQDNESLQSQLTFERDAKNAYLTMLEILPKLWENHQKTKFKSDGSHLQADIELNRIMVGIKDAVKK